MGYSFRYFFYFLHFNPFILLSNSIPILSGNAWNAWRGKERMPELIYATLCIQWISILIMNGWSADATPEMNY